MKEIKRLRIKENDDDWEYGEVSMEELWEAAYMDVKDKLKFDTDEQKTLLANFRTMADPIAQTEFIFREWRHPDTAGTPDEQERERKIRQNVQTCLTWAQDACTYAQNHASGTFAQPVQIFAGGLVYLFQAAKDVSADLDTVQSTFQTIATAMQEINSMDRHPLVTPVAKRSLVEVFVTLLLFCSYVGWDLRKHSRLKLWRNKVFKLNIDSTAKECETVEEAVRKFHNAIQAEALNDIKDIKEGVNWLIKNTNTKMQQTIFLGGMYNPTERGNVLDKLAQTLQHRLDLNLTVMSHMATRMDTTMARQISGVSDWLMKEPEFKRWLAQPDKDSLLYIKGNDGVGKTFLTAYCYKWIPIVAEANHQLLQKDLVRQQLVVTYFLFEPGMQHFQTFPSVIASILFQIAAQDPKWCDSISAKPSVGTHSPERIWKELVLKRFEKRAHPPETLYILLDGLTDMQPKEREKLLGLFDQTLKVGKYSVWILLTGSGEPPKTTASDTTRRSLPTIEATDKNIEDRVKKIFETRRKGFPNLSKLQPDQDKYSILLNYLVKSSKGNLSILDQMLEILDQHATEKKVLEKFISEAESGEQHLFYKALQEPDNPVDKAVKRVLWWCAFAKQTLSVFDLDTIIHLDQSLQEIKIDTVLKRCSGLLYTQSMLPPNLGPQGMTRKPPVTSKYEYVEFRQASFREHIRRGGNIFQDVNTAKVKIFVTICNILCDSSATIAESLQEYAAFHVVSHLRDIDLKVREKEATDKIPKEGTPKDKISKDKEAKVKGARNSEPGPKQTGMIRPKDLNQAGRALYRLMSNETSASSVFEKVESRMANSQIDFELYDLPQSPNLRQRTSKDNGLVVTSTNSLVQDWANELAGGGNEGMSLPPQIFAWAERTVNEPRNMLECLAYGHLRSWAQKTTAEDARVPYRLAYRAFCTTTSFEHWSHGDDQMHTEIAEAMLGRCRESWTLFAQGRLAAALLLYQSPNKRDQDYALFLHERNCQLDESMCAEKLYSLLGLAEHHDPSFRSPGSANASWEKVRGYTEEALKCLRDSDVALQPNLNAESCKRVYMLHAKACEALGYNDQARDTCLKALGSSLLQNCRGMGDFLTILVGIYANQQAHAKIMELVHKEFTRQPTHFMPEWLMNRPRNTTHDDRLRRGAAVTGHVDLVIRLYDGAICYWAQKGLFHETCVMLYELAVIYRQDCQAIKMAEDILNRLLDAVKKDGTLYMDSTLLSMIIAERIDIFFMRHRNTPGQRAKRALCRAAEELITYDRVADVIESSTRAGVMITLAKMYKETNHKYDAYRHADHAFQICIADLEDWVDENDMYAFRALAKVLHFAGLKRDAGIAASLIFDRANANTQGVSEIEYLSTLSSAIDHGDEIRPRSAEVSLNVCPSTDRCSSAPSLGLITDSIPSPQSTISSLAHNSTGDCTYEVESTVALTSPSSNPLETVFHGIDEGNQSVLHCMGSCGKKNLSQWDLGSAPWYFCLDCPSTDYCYECYGNKKAYNHAPAKALWSKVCWGEHAVIPQPTPGWKGVRGGVIRIGSSSRGVKDWLTDMKQRWAVEVKANARRDRP
ncbi:hypothetical protein BBP40_010603 [Aspergillus hancockii]|nr:hypothetical protein BBP40_010603 [Aspergillus hancockii]